jgi:hypothetical protein
VQKRLASGEVYAAFAHCGHNQVKWRAVQSSVIALDSALGFPSPLGAAATETLQQRVLQVVFARRAGRRFILNLEDLLHKCAAASFKAGWKLNCSALHMGSLAPDELVRTMRGTDCFIAMHGGDMVHGLHMLPGRTAVELLNYEFRNARWDWRNQHKDVLEPALRFRRIVLPPPGGQGADTRQTSDWGNPAVFAQTQRGWNQNAYLPWAAIEHVLVCIIAREEVAGRRPGPHNATVETWTQRLRDCEVQEGADRS